MKSSAREKAERFCREVNQDINSTDSIYKCEIYPSGDPGSAAVLVDVSSEKYEFENLQLLVDFDCSQTGSGDSVHFSSLLPFSFSKEPSTGLILCNHLNKTKRWASFYLDDDYDLCFQLDMQIKDMNNFTLYVVMMIMTVTNVISRSWKLIATYASH